MALGCSQCSVANIAPLRMRYLRQSFYHSKPKEKFDFKYMNKTICNILSTFLNLNVYKNQLRCLPHLGWHISQQYQRLELNKKKMTSCIKSKCHISRQYAFFQICLFPVCLFPDMPFTRYAFFQSTRLARIHVTLLIVHLKIKHE